MAGKPQVTLTFAGDSSKLESTFSKVGASARGMEREVGAAGAGFDKVGEAADNVDTKAMGFRDTMTGVEDSMKGASLIAKGDLFEGFLTLGMGVGDLASGMFNFLVPSMKAGALWLKNTTVATKAMTIAQKALNLVMRMNPIGLIVTALVLLVGGIILAYKRSETFRRVVDTAMRGIRAAFMWMVNGFGAAWTALSGAWTRFAGWISGWKGSITARISSLFSAYVSAFGAAWSTVSGAWGRFTGWVSGWKGSITARVSSLFSSAISAFGAAWSGISGAWGRFTAWVGGWKQTILNKISGIADTITAPFRAAFNGIRDLWNSTLGGKGFSFPGFDPPGPGALPGFSFTIPRFHNGGIMPGAPGSEGLALLQAGERVTPAGRSDVTVIEIRSGGSRLDDLLVEMLRRSIQTRGGNVQVVLGT